MPQKNLNVIKESVIDSKKDEHRYAITLNTLMRKSEKSGVFNHKLIERFLKPEALEFKKKTFYAGGMTCSSKNMSVSEEDGDTRIIYLDNFDGSDLNVDHLKAIFFVCGKELKKLAEEIFKRCLL